MEDLNACYCLGGGGVSRAIPTNPSQPYQSRPVPAAIVPSGAAVYKGDMFLTSSRPESLHELGRNHCTSGGQNPRIGRSEGYIPRRQKQELKACSVGGPPLHGITFFYS